MNKIKQFACDNNTIPKYVVVDGKRMSLKTAMAVYGHGGRNKLPAQSRASRFYSYAFKPVKMETDCSDEDCEKWSVGDYGEFPLKTKLIQGKVVSIAYRKSKKGLCYPSSRFCKCLGSYFTLWIYSNSLKEILKVAMS